MVQFRLFDDLKDSIRWRVWSVSSSRWDPCAHCSYACLPRRRMNARPCLVWRMYIFFVKFHSLRIAREALIMPVKWYVHRNFQQKIDLVLCNIRLAIKWRSKKSRDRALNVRWRSRLEREVGVYPVPSQLKGLGERRKLPQRSPRRSPGRKRISGMFWALSLGNASEGNNVNDFTVFYRLCITVIVWL